MAEIATVGPTRGRSLSDRFGQMEARGDAARNKSQIPRLLAAVAAAKTRNDNDKRHHAALKRPLFHGAARSCEPSQAVLRGGHAANQIFLLRFAFCADGHGVEHTEI